MKTLGSKNMDQSILWRDLRAQTRRLSHRRQIKSNGEPPRASTTRHPHRTHQSTVGKSKAMANRRAPQRPAILIAPKISCLSLYFSSLHPVHRPFSRSPSRQERLAFILKV
jgi:hypothetical protein